MMTTTTTTLNYLSLEDNYAAYRPVGKFTLDETIDMIDGSIAYCRRKKIGALLVDITRVTGFPPPSTVERFHFATKLADTAGGKVTVSFITPPELIDPDRIAVTMANNRGMQTNVFTAESEAIRWLITACGISDKH